MKPAEFRRRVKAFQCARNLSTLGKAVAVLAKLIPKGERTVWRYLKDGLPEALDDRVNNLTSDVQPK